MILSTLIQKGGLAKLATATPATVATVPDDLPPTVARVATVAVANLPETAVHTQSVPTQLTSDQEARIRAWFASIDEHDELTIAEFLEKCRVDMDARADLLRRSTTVSAQIPIAGPVRCGECRHFERTDHPHLGHCAKGEPEAPAGIWDADQRSCNGFLGNNEALGVRESPPAPHSRPCAGRR